MREYPAVFTRFEGTELMNYSPLIYAFDKQNIAVSGKARSTVTQTDGLVVGEARAGWGSHAIETSGGSVA